MDARAIVRLIMMGTLALIPTGLIIIAVHDLCMWYKNKRKVIPEETHCQCGFPLPSKHRVLYEGLFLRFWMKVEVTHECTHCHKITKY